MSSWDDFYGPNAGYALELYEQYQRDPNSLDPQTRAFFATVAPPSLSDTPIASTNGTVDNQSQQSTINTKHASIAQLASSIASTQSIQSTQDVAHIVAAARLARSIREYGHLAANIDPLGAARPGDPMLDAATHGISDADLAALPGSIVWPAAGASAGTCLEAINRLRGIYSGTLGYEFDHIQDFDERIWLHEVVETGAYRPKLDAVSQRALLQRLSAVEGFEQFLHTTFQGQKRFSIEGMDMLVPMLDTLIRDAASAGAHEVLIGMAHRGRLNVLAHILQKPYPIIFSEFHAAPNKELVPSEGSTGINYGWTGDVKYHLGAEKVVQESAAVQVKLTLAHNPSHLEFVNPVIEGATRAAQEERRHPGAPTQDTSVALPVTIHGDAAFPGEGVVAETLNLSRLPGYQTGGTIHIVANNQVGFTTEARDGRSTLYASDLAKGFEIPIIHVNADDPEACLSAVRLAHAYRLRFQKDFLIDLIGYRRWGHNEGDEPAFTQPRLYAQISQHPTVRALYAEQLQREGIVDAEAAEQMQREVRERLQAALQELQAGHVQQEQVPLTDAPTLASIETALPAETLREFNQALLTRPAGFTPHARLERTLQRRRETIEKAGGIEWAFAESLAFASILADGIPIRLTGQDTERGTFSQRHLVLHDSKTGATYTPLQALPQAQASFAVYNSPLSEAAALGFEYGFSVHAPQTMVLWEAQFGDFANAWQVLIDQFIAAARSKWRQLPGLVLLLPHGYEGQGPEHSSGRLERYLQLAAEDNLRIVNCTTAAQYFHLLRAQAALRGAEARPLVVMTPKSLLRHPLAASSLSDLTNGHFQPVLQDAHAAQHHEQVQRLILCSGKIAVDLAMAAEKTSQAEHVAVARVEQLYPFPAQQLQQVISSYPQMQEIVWLQEEPRNMGAWNYIMPRLQTLIGDNLPLQYIGRPEHASTAEGQADAHAAEQARIIAAAYASEQRTEAETTAAQSSSRH